MTGLRELAERIVLSPHLDDKRIDPTGATDDDRGTGFTPPPLPARPVELRARTRTGLRLPSPHQLGSERARGSLLHLFANHELLAIELMALALLRFPDAPPPLRRGLAAALRDEQRHLGLYMARLEELGLPFGSLPLSSFLWTCLADVPDIGAFLAGMSLTVEQANLDHTSAWQRHLRAVGDHASAEILAIIHRDEIRHVRLGWTWLERWRAPDADPFDAWQQRLHPPLTPARACGPELDEAARREVGLPDSFVRRLAVFRHSRGRPPRVHLFQPDCEDRIARGRPGHTPTRAVRDLAADLATVPLAMCAEDDVILVPREPSLAWRERVRDAGLPLPQFLVWDGRSARSAVGDRRVGGLRPWGWDPDVHTALRGLALGPDPQGLSGWSPDLAILARKSLGVQLLRRFLDSSPDAAWLSEPSTVGRTARDIDAAVGLVAELGVTCVVKADLGAAGRHRARVDPPVSEADRDRIARLLAHSGVVVVEPWLDRIVDLGVQLQIGGDGPRVEGITRSMVDDNGRFRGVYLGSWSAGLDAGIARFAHGHGTDPGRLVRALTQAGALCGAHLFDAGYRGPAGVDALVHRVGPGEAGLHLRPIVEINPRTTMGRIGLELARHVDPSTAAAWVLVPLLGRSAPDMVARLDAWLPLARSGLLRRGAVPTNDPATAGSTLSVLVVAPTRDELTAVVLDLLPPNVRHA